MEYKISDETSIKELKDILYKANGAGDIIICENDKVFNTVIKFIDAERDSLIHKLNLQETNEKIHP